ncbi:DUF3102 domain-containing protein [uncultured Nitratireductor sp.]|uniref:DUF3102 domain-containing protein n=1 Tax=uncultured Nitratireductor sp. TaxID=520953 RepID=UPI002611A0A8|nr:DUF3102 domain-containing protein [uncultured Nitratireductor sp.]
MTLSNKLADLAERVKEAKIASAEAQRVSVTKALEAGHTLNLAKAECKHGDWLPFLNRAEIGERTAQQYMKLSASGLEIRSVADLGSIRAALAFVSKWKLPAFDEMLMISDPRHEVGVESFDRGAAFIWEDGEHRGYFNVGMIVCDGDDETAIVTKRPMKAMVEVEGDRPVNTIIHFLLTNGFTLPIDEWELSIISREPQMALVLAPFFAENTFRHPERGGAS